jgi:hypothetical protein
MDRNARSAFRNALPRGGIYMEFLDRRPDGAIVRSPSAQLERNEAQFERNENEHAGLYGLLASSSSMAATIRGSSAVTSGAKRATTSPLRLSRNFSKFHSTSAEFAEFTP